MSINAQSRNKNTERTNMSETQRGHPPAERTMTRAEWGELPATLLCNRRFLVRDPGGRRITEDEDGPYYRLPGEGYTDRDRAAVYTDRMLPDLCSDCILELLPEAPAPPPRPGQKCRLDSVLKTELIKLIQLAPENEVVRTQVHAAILVPLPPEAKTFDEISKWIEDNIDPATLKSKPAPMVNTMPVAVEAAPTMTIEVNVTDVESGTCRYSVCRHGCRNSEFSVNDLRSAIDDNEITTLEELADEVRDLAYNDADEDGPDMEWDNDSPSHDDYESDGTEDREITPPRPQAIRDELLQFLLVNAPDILVQLGENQVPTPTTPTTDVAF